MIPLREVAVLDGNAQALGVPVMTLMENAGRGVADLIQQRFPKGPVLVLAGPGNNGGDGLVAARLLAEARRLTIVLAAGRTMKTQPAARALKALPDGVEVLEAPVQDLERRLASAGVIVDALLGSGISGALREPYATLVRAAAPHAAKIVSVDVPTGFPGAAALRPAATVTFHDEKEGMTRETCGDILVKDIGIPSKAATHTGPGELSLYPVPRADQHKGEGGFVLVVGGGPYTGAPAMTALAAMRTGADLGVVLTPKRAHPVVASFSPNLVVRPLNGDHVDFRDPENRVNLNLWVKRADAVVVGPGMGKFDVARESVLVTVRAARDNGKPVVVDADAIWAMADDLGALAGPVVVTPHAAEFKSLTGAALPVDLDERARIAATWSKKIGATLLVKGPVDVVTDGDRVKRNETGCPQMSVGGTGDVLAGVVGCLLAKGLPAFDAARVGAFLTGLAGEYAVQDRPYGLLASDVAEAIPKVLGRFLPKPPLPRF